MGAGPFETRNSRAETRLRLLPQPLLSTSVYPSEPANPPLNRTTSWRKEPAGKGEFCGVRSGCGKGIRRQVDLGPNSFSRLVAVRLGPPVSASPRLRLPSALKKLFPLPRGAAVGSSWKNSWWHIGRGLVNSHLLPAPPLPSPTARAAIISLCLRMCCRPLPTQFLSSEVEVLGRCLPSHGTQACSVAGKERAGGGGGRRRGRQAMVWGPGGVSRRLPTTSGLLLQAAC